MFKRLAEFIRHGIWQKSDGDAAKSHWAVRPFKIAIYTVRGIGEHDIIVRSAALTFYTVMFIVPIAALIFGFMKGFGLEGGLAEFLYGMFPESKILIDYLLSFASNMLEETKGGIIAIFGLVILFWAVIRVFGNVEDAFNSIWEIKKKRPLPRKFSDYITVLFIAPVLFISATSLSNYVKDSLSFLNVSWLVDILLGIASFMLIWLLFAFIYWIMPNTKVKFKGAFIAGIIAGTFFQIFQLLYMFFQSELSNYNAIYGTFAAVPFFLMWLHVSWQIVLIGAELSFAYQNIDGYQMEMDAANINIDHKRKIMIAVMITIIKRFKDNEGATGAEEIASELKVSVRVVRDVLYDLEEAGFIVPINDNKDNRQNFYIPAKDIHSITIMDIIEGVETHGSAKPDIDGMPEFEKVSHILDTLKGKATGSDLNVLLVDLIK